MTAQATGRKPQTKASLSGELADFLIELSSAFQKHSIYPAGHPALGPATTDVLTRLSKLLAQRESLSIGVAREQLVIEGVATDSEHPLLNSLASRLHKHELGAISFAEGVKPEEIADVLCLVSAEPERTGRPLGREPEEMLKGRPHVRLHPVRYDSLKLRESESRRAERERIGKQLWVGLAQAALALEAEAEGVAEAGRPPGPGLGPDFSPATGGDAVAATLTDAPVPPPSGEDGSDTYDPETVARAIDDRGSEAGYDQIIVGYMVQIARDLKGADPLEASELRDRFSALLKKLKPGTLRRLLHMGGDDRQRKAFLLDAAQGVALDAVLELVQAALEEEENDISRWMMRLLSKMARHASASDGYNRHRADGALREQVQQLLSGWQLENPNPTEYERALVRMSVRSPVATHARGAGNEPEAARLVQTSLETGTASEALSRATDELLLGEGAAELIRLLDAAPGTGETEEGPANEAAAQIWDRLTDPAVIRRLLEEDEPDPESLQRIVPRAGIAAADVLLDRLSTSKTLSTRRKVFDWLIALGPAAGPLAAERVERSDEVPWFVVRNVLALLSAMPDLPPGFDPSTFRTHPNGRVRYEALKLCMRRPDLRDAALIDALADPAPRTVGLGVVEAERGAPPEAEPHLRRVALDPVVGSEIRVHALRALGFLGTKGALETLLSIAKPHRTLFGRELPERTPELLAVLEALASGWAEEPRAADVLSLAREAGLPATPPSRPGDRP